LVQYHNENGFEETYQFKLSTKSKICMSLFGCEWVQASFLAGFYIETETWSENFQWYIQVGLLPPRGTELCLGYFYEGFLPMMCNL